ncbi:uncharacterized protein LOC126989218 isoform X1 [Eriocheir sinensis]|uniref:uncharacterized protein LOC126989218 isoform X1 n=1 Tax=Eriocheir sinensis TaxID=95602 RepID=UPI0021CAA780|nr:uncharacterized protein LOC126989218 isoform X1 [Eriocheir sinensis]
MSQKRTYPSGAEKRKRKKEEEEKKCRDKGALLKYFGGTEAAQWQSASSGSTVCNPSELAPPSCVPNVPSVSATTDDLPGKLTAKHHLQLLNSHKVLLLSFKVSNNIVKYYLLPLTWQPFVVVFNVLYLRSIYILYRAHTPILCAHCPLCVCNYRRSTWSIYILYRAHTPACVPTVPSVSATTDDLPATSTTTSTSHHGSSSAPPVDPAEWPSFLSDSDRTEQVIMGPLPIKESFSFPKRYDGRSFHYHYTNRQLVNGEKVKRSWLTYSRSKDAVYCFCCKLFSKKSIKLATDGQQDWVNIGALLKQHEKSEDHCSNMVKWKEFSLRLSKGKTIDETEMGLLEAEKIAGEMFSHA